MSPDDPASPASSVVTDVIQGRQLSLDEFEQVLGLNAVLEVGSASVKCLALSFVLIKPNIAAGLQDVSCAPELCT